MYGIFTYIYHKNQLSLGEYTIHGFHQKLNGDLTNQVAIELFRYSGLFGVRETWVLLEISWNPVLRPFRGVIRKVGEWCFHSRGQDS